MEDPTPIDRLEAMVSAAGLKSHRQSPTHLMVKLALENERTQVVHLAPAGTVAMYTVINIVSFSLLLGETAVPDAATLLHRNGEHKVGYWSVYTLGDGKYLGIGHNQFLETLDSEALRILIVLLAQEADALEQSLTGEDQF